MLITLPFVFILLSCGCVCAVCVLLAFYDGFHKYFAIVEVAFAYPKKS